MSLLAYARRKKALAKPARAASFHLPAPIGGVNTVSPGTDLPASDSIYSYNLIGAEYGLRSRLGWREWVTGLDGPVRSLLPFTGSTKDGANNRLFACTQTGIWDVSSSTTTPTRVVTFGTQNGDSGYGSSTVMVTAAGHFLCYCDEANGYHVYAESGATWAVVTPAATIAWAAGTAYIVGDRRLNGGLTYECTVAGTSAAAPDTGPSGTGGAIVDGGVTWKYVARVLSGVDPALLVAVLPWKNRLWLVERDTARAWYLGVGAVTGAATSFTFGQRFQHGGDLRCLASWSIDGGSGIDDRLVAISGGGDVVIYAGTDPSQASTFSLVGVWYVGAVPTGRRLTTDSGGDLLVMSSIGILPMSKLVIGNPLIDRTQFQTAKISNLFNQLQAATATVRGWSMRLHPQDAALMVLVPQGAGASSTQLVMSLTTRGWHQYRDLPIGQCAEPWNGTLYFGTENGRVCVNDGYVDGVTLADPNSYSSINWSLLTAFSNFGVPNQKRIHWIRPYVSSQGGAIPFQAQARYNFDFSEIQGSGIASASGSATWDTAKWDQALWAGAYQPAQQVFGAQGIGPEVAIAMRGSASSRMTLVGIDVSYDTGGLL